MCEVSRTFLDESGVDTAVCIYPRTTDLYCVCIRSVLTGGVMANGFSEGSRVMARLMCMLSVSGDHTAVVALTPSTLLFMVCV